MSRGADGSRADLGAAPGGIVEPTHHVLGGWHVGTTAGSVSEHIVAVELAVDAEQMRL